MIKVRGTCVIAIMLAGTARADDRPEPDIWIDYSAPSDGLGAATVDEIEALDDVRIGLLHGSALAVAHCEALLDRGVDEAVLIARMQQHVQATETAREQVVGRLEAMFPANHVEPGIADALVLLEHLYRDQEGTRAQRDALGMEDAEPCDTGEITEAIIQDKEYLVQVAASWFVNNFPDDPRRTDVQLDLLEAYDSLGWEDRAVGVLGDLLCPDAGDADLERSLDQLDQQLGERVYGGSTVDYATCRPSAALAGADQAAAWQRLAEYERRSPGRHAAALAALVRATTVTDTPPSVSLLWELADAYVEAGMRIEAVPVLDDVATRAFGDAADVGIGDVAVARTGEVLALLWRESSLPTADAALKLARIYFHAGRRRDPHVRGVYAALATALRDLGAYEQAASVAREVVEAWPLHPAAPHAASIRIDIEIERGDREAADQARAELIVRFSDGSAWVEANAGGAAKVLVDDTRIALARSRYRIAAAAVELANATVELASARTALEGVIDGSSSRAQVIEARFLLGEVVGWQGDPAAAAARFAEVAAALPEGEALRHAALGREVLAREAVVDGAVARQELTLPPVPRDVATLVGATATEMPDAVAALRASYDTVLPTIERDDEAARVLLRAATLDLRYARADDAERGLRALLADHCFSDSARAAKDTLVALVGARDGSAAGDAISADVATRGCLDTATALAARDKDLEKQRKRASALTDKGDHAGAARLLAAAYLQTPSSSGLADDILADAAIAWERAGELARAARLWTELDRRPELARSPLWREMLLHRAQVLDRQLDWPRAAAAYLAVAAAASVKQGKKAADPTMAWDATWRAAELLGHDHAWLEHGDDPGAIALFLRVARSSSAKADAAWLRAAELARRAGKRELLAAIHTEWHKKHKDRETDLLLELALAQASEAAGDRKGAEVHYREVVANGWDAKDARELVAAAAIDAVATAKFWLIEDGLRSDDALTKFRWGKSQEEDAKIMTKIGDKLGKLASDLYDLGNRAPRWEAATQVRLAELTLAWIEAIVAAPPPDWLIAELKLEKAADSAGYAVQMRKTLEGEYRSIASGLKRALAVPKAVGMEKWLRIAEQRLAELGEYVPDAGGVRTEVFVEEIR